MTPLKITSWNIEHLDKLIQPGITAPEKKRKDAIVDQINRLNPDILCVLEGPKGTAKIKEVCKTLLNNNYLPVTRPEGDAGFGIQGQQWIWFLVRKTLHPQCTLLPAQTWHDYTGAKNWKVNYWGNFTTENHNHYRLPQVLVLDINNTRIEFIGLHLKSKFVNQGEQMWNAGGDRKNEYIREAIKARIKMATEAANVRAYINKRFTQTQHPAIFIMGDLNDGPGKDYFENQFLFFDLLNNIQGDIFEAEKFLNHALFDYPAHLRWSTTFKDFVDPNAPRQQLIDHILFTQALVRWKLNVCIEAGAGKIEHEIHDLVNSTLPASQKTSDHKPVSVILSVK